MGNGLLAVMVYHYQLLDISMTFNFAKTDDAIGRKPM